jgi:hypothetical protein
MNSHMPRVKQIFRKDWRRARGDQRRSRKEAGFFDKSPREPQETASSTGEKVLFGLRFLAASFSLLKASEGIWPKIGRALGRIWH